MLALLKSAYARINSLKTPEIRRTASPRRGDVFKPIIVGLRSPEVLAMCATITTLNYGAVAALDSASGKIRLLLKGVVDRLH